MTTAPTAPVRRMPAPARVAAVSRRRRAGARPVIAPPPGQRAPVWDRPVPVRHGAMPDERPPLLWLMAAHGGAGATTLEQVLAPAADCHRRWPAPHPGETPYVLVLARETASGLAAADALLRQHHAGLGGDATVVGLVTVAARPGRMPAPIRRDRDLYAGLVEHSWRIGWHEPWMLTGHDGLPVWSPHDPEPEKRSRADDLAAVPPDVRDLGRELIGVIDEVHRAVHGQEGS